MSGVRKYRNVPTVVDGMRFDSKAEARRWQELQLLERAGEIFNLARQIAWPLDVNGQRIGCYRSDFEYFTKDGVQIVEDVKGVRTPLYKLKARLMMAIHGIEIREVSA